MRGKSHRQLGHYLVQRYMADSPRRYTRAFLIGCVEPDRNPATYLKGSLRCQWLRGHNYQNARRFMRHISRRLEQKDHWNLVDYYTLGKLIHYTTDAFTYAHNETFPTNLSDHREYEAELQNHFLCYLQEDPEINPKVAKTVMGAIADYHREYMDQGAGIQTDAKFALTACCCVLAVFFSNQIL